ncbi:MAG TPA: hydroxylamine reductase [Syntrophales bacterium]|nr:hydroxylamine reductase [Syntrophales bacterium]
MFCYQCEQTARGEACTKAGVCGKQADVAALQDLLTYALVGLSLVAVEGRKVGVSESAIDKFICGALFATLTNVNFDPARFSVLLSECTKLRDVLFARVKAAGGNITFTHDSVRFKPAGSVEKLVSQGEKVGLKFYPAASEDILSLKHMALFGIRGIAAYADHAAILGSEDAKLYAFLQEGLSQLVNENLTLDEGVALVLKCGEMNLRAMELLDAGHTSTYGHPVPTKVPLGTKKGKAILVSGHDLKDLEELLKQTAGKGIYVYTHGEMLSSHGYPKLKKYEHFYGHYGTAWQNQAKEFAEFPGSILMTTNCIQRPQPSYIVNIFTSGQVGWPGVSHITNRDFTPVIKKAIALPGFAADTDRGSVTVGFGRNAILSVADKIIAAVKDKHIRHFFLVAGCDGAKPGRNYYTNFVELVPKDCVVLTLACGKFRFFDMELGDTGGIPRLLDVGQCNDAYSAIQVAVALSKAFGVGVNELPLSMILSWYEQKAVAILLTLLSLGIKNIRLGPSLPAFTSPNVLDFLVKTFNIKPITTPEADLKAILG